MKSKILTTALIFASLFAVQSCSKETTEQGILPIETPKVVKGGFSTQAKYLFYRASYNEFDIMEGAKLIATYKATEEGGKQLNGILQTAKAENKPDQKIMIFTENNVIVASNKEG